MAYITRYRCEQYGTGTICSMIYEEIGIKTDKKVLVFLVLKYKKILDKLVKVHKIGVSYMICIVM